MRQQQPGMPQRFMGWLARTWRSGRNGKIGIIVGALFLVGLCQNLAGGSKSRNTTTTPMAFANVPTARATITRAPTNRISTMLPSTATPVPTRTPRPTSTIGPTNIPPPQVVMSSAANMRSGPNVGFAPVETLQPNTEVTVIGYQDFSGQRWYQVKTSGGAKGWVSGTLLPVDSTAAARVPAVTQTFKLPPTAVPPTPAPTAPAAQQCDPSYPDLCLPPGFGDTLNCGDIPYKRFRVVGVDRHKFDRDRDGIGCES